MPAFATTRMSSKGQVVIPEEIRTMLGLQEGTQFVVVGQKDAVILKTITAPSLAQFNNLMAEAKKQARLAGMKRTDIKAAIAKVRGKK